jgi:hypothetical protein
MKNRNITFTATLLALVCFALLPEGQAVNPPPDGGYAGGNTAEGQNALLSLTTGGFNTAVGFLSLRSSTTGAFNTAIGAGTLFANTADNNTATGAGALLSNTIGTNNTAEGTFALFNNTTGAENTANGVNTLLHNTTETPTQPSVATHSLPIPPAAPILLRGSMFCAITLTVILIPESE